MLATFFSILTHSGRNIYFDTFRSEYLQTVRLRTFRSDND